MKIAQLFRNFGILFSAELISSIIGFPVKILAGRFLGPVEYGKYALILDLSQYFILPIVLYRTSIQQYIPRSKFSKKIISNFNLLFVVSFVLSYPILYAANSYLAKLLKINNDIVIWAIVFSAVSGSYYFYESIARSLNKYLLLAKGIILNSFLLLSLFAIIIVVFKDTTYTAYVLSATISYLLISVIFIKYLTSGTRIFRFDKKIIKKIITYSLYALIGGITGLIIGNTARFFINNYLGLYWVGIYSAYINAANLFIGRFFQVFLNVFFPTISAEKNKQNMLSKLDNIYKLLAIPIACITFISILFVIFLFGDEYPLRMDLAVLLSINMLIYIYYQIRMWALNSLGVKGIKQVSKALVVNSFINIVLYILLIPHFGILGVIYSSIIVNLLFLIYFRKLADKYINNQNLHEEGQNLLY